MRRLALVLALGVLALVGPTPAHADTFHVDDDASGTGCTLVDKCATIGQGVLAARGAGGGGGHTIQVAAGSYVETLELMDPLDEG
jgi:hypothetical protein